MKDIYFVKYSFDNESQPLIRIHCNTNISVPRGTSDYWEFINVLTKTDRLNYQKGIVIDFMVKVGEEEE